MKKQLLSLLVCSFFSPFCMSAAGYVKTAEGIRVTVDSVEVDVQYYTPSTVRIVNCLPVFPPWEKATRL